MKPETLDLAVTYLTIILLLLGVLFAIFPKLIVQMNRLGNKVLFRDDVILNRLRGMGIALLIIGTFVIINVWLTI